MARTKRPKNAFDQQAGFWGEPRQMDRETRQAILDEAGTDLPDAFFRTLAGIAAEYRGRLTLKVPKPSETKGALLLIAKQSRELLQTVQGLDFASRAWIECSGLAKGTAPLEAELSMLEAAATRAHESLPPKTRPSDPAKPVAARRLHALFEWHGLPFTQTEPNGEIGYRGLAEVCLSWIFGDGKRVGYWLKLAQESTQ